MLNLNKQKLLHLHQLLDEYSLQISESIGVQVQLEITAVAAGAIRNETAEDLMLGVVASAVCDSYRIRQHELISDSRQHPLPDARALCYLLIKSHHPKMPLKKIGQYFGGRDHSTISTALATVKDLLETEKALQKTFKQLSLKISTYEQPN